MIVQTKSLGMDIDYFFSSPIGGYKIEVDDKNKVNIDMTLTSPNCPVAESLPNDVKKNIMNVEGVTDVNLNLVWEPPWDRDKMSEAAKLELDIN